MSLSAELRSYAAHHVGTGAQLCAQAADELDRVAPYTQRGRGQYVAIPEVVVLLSLLEEARPYLRSRLGVCVTCNALTTPGQWELNRFEHAPDCLAVKVQGVLAKHPGHDSP